MISTTPLLCRPHFLHIRTVVPNSSPLSTCCLSHCKLTNPHLSSGWSQRDLRLPSSSVLIPRLSVSCKAGIAEINEIQFADAVLKSDLPVLVEFVANWCGPCRLIAPAIQSLAQEYEGSLRVVKIDHDANPKLIEEYKVYGLPTLILFKNGEEVADSRREGAITKEKLKEYIDTLLQSNPVA